MLKVNFSYSDAFNQETNLAKTFTNDILDVETEFDVLVSEFKNFLCAACFAKELIDTIQVVEINEDQIK